LHMLIIHASWLEPPLVGLFADALVVVVACKHWLGLYECCGFHMPCSRGKSTATSSLISLSFIVQHKI
jgi:hypothetical protein